MPRRERVLSALRVAGRTMAGHPAMTGTHYPHVKHRKCRENFAQVDRKCEIHPIGSTAREGKQTNTFGGQEERRFRSGAQVDANTRRLCELQNLFCGAAATGNGAMDGAVVARCVSVLACKKQCVSDRGGECCLATFASCFHVAVGATGERVGVPVVEVGSVQLRIEAR